MGDISLGEPYARYVAVTRLMLDTFSMKCLDASFSNYLRDMTNTSWDGPAAGGGRWVWKWYFCACVNTVYVCVLVSKCHLRSAALKKKWLFLFSFYFWAGSLVGCPEVCVLFLWHRMTVRDNVMPHWNFSTVIMAEQSSAAEAETPVSPSPDASGDQDIIETGGRFIWGLVTGIMLETLKTNGITAFNTK